MVTIQLLATNKTHIYLTTGNTYATYLTKDKKDKHSVSGELHIDMSIDSNLTNIKDIYLNGSWEKTKKDTYLIAGELNFSKPVPDNNGYVVFTYQAMGTFEIKSE